MWWQRELRRLGYAAMAGLAIGLCNFAVFHQHLTDKGPWPSIAVATIGGIVGIYMVDFVIPWLRRELRR